MEHVAESPAPWKAALLSQFLDVTATRLVELDIERSTLQTGGDPHHTTQEICNIVHKIAGTADSFGFSDLGRQANTTEAICSHILTLPADLAGAAVTQHLLPALDSLIDHLDHTLRAPLTELGL
ncbi:MAG: Hpt domain-containing protein [Paracoccaceae bacterium]